MRGYQYLSYSSRSSSSPITSAHVSPRKIRASLEKREQVPLGYWKDPANHKLFFDRLFTQLRFSALDDLYGLRKEDIRKHGGGGMLHYYNNSPSQAIMSVYSNVEWQMWRFERVPVFYWHSLVHQRQLFDWLSIQMKINRIEDWYSINTEEALRYESVSSLVHHYYGNSLILALQSVYPEYQWQPWKFNKVPSGWWEDESNAIQYIEWLTDQIDDIDQLRDLTLQQLNQLGAQSLIEHCGGISSFLNKYFPNVTRSNSNTGTTISKIQTALYNAVRTLFADTKVEINYRHPDLLFSQSKQRMQLDIFIPELLLALEYQGPQHYSWHYLYGSDKLQRKRDQEKKEACLRDNIQLIIIPYWWDQTVSSLAATIAKDCPRLSSQLKRETVIE